MEITAKAAQRSAFLIRKQESKAGEWMLMNETARYKTITDTSADCGKTHRNTCANESSGYHNCVFHEKILLKTFN